MPRTKDGGWILDDSEAYYPPYSVEKPKNPELPDDIDQQVEDLKRQIRELQEKK